MIDNNAHYVIYLPFLLSWMTTHDILYQSMDDDDVHYLPLQLNVENLLFIYLSEYLLIKLFSLSLNIISKSHLEAIVLILHCHCYCAKTIKIQYLSTFQSEHINIYITCEVSWLFCVWSCSMYCLYCSVSCSFSTETLCKDSPY